MELFKTQYDWVVKTRETLFEYCETLSQVDYLKKLDAFGGDSIRDLHAHVAGCYRIWLGKRALGTELKRIDLESIKEVEAMRQLFKETDEIVSAFLNEFEGKWDASVRVDFEIGQNSFTPLWLFTHTMTHEFHHKGQIVKIGRYLGYIPPETDLIEL